MNSREILESVLMQGKTAVLDFPDIASVRSFKSALFTYKTRWNRTAESLGAGDILDGQSICSSQKVLDDGVTIRAKFWLGEPVDREPKYKLVSVEDAQESESES